MNVYLVGLHMWTKSCHHLHNDPLSKRTEQRESDERDKRIYSSIEADCLKFPLFEEKLNFVGEMRRNTIYWVAGAVFVGLDHFQNEGFIALLMVGRI